MNGRLLDGQLLDGRILDRLLLDGPLDVELLDGLLLDGQLLDGQLLDRLLLDRLQWGHDGWLMGHVRHQVLLADPFSCCWLFGASGLRLNVLGQLDAGEHEA
jgi:hypothetical protein